MYDVIVIGGGPAGITAGIYLARAGVKTLILEKESIGGKIASSPLVENYPGFVSISGGDLASNLYDQAIEMGCDFDIETVVSIEDGDVKRVVTEDNSYECKAIVVATGCKNNKLRLEKEEEFIGNGIYFCATCDGAFFKDRNVAVVGGANSAVTNAIYLAKLAKQVYLICIEDDLISEKRLSDQIKNLENVEIITSSKITKLIGDKDLSSLEVDTNGAKRIIEVDGLFEAIGMSPETDIAKDLLELNKFNYFKSSDCTTSKDGIFVAGDCRDKNIRQLTTATSDGTVAAMLALDYLNAVEK